MNRVSAPFSKHRRRHGVVAQMAGPALANIGRVHIVAHELGHPVGTNASRGQEQRAPISTNSTGTAGQIGAHIVAIFLDRCEGADADRDHTVLSPLALATISVPRSASMSWRYRGGPKDVATLPVGEAYVACCSLGLRCSRTPVSVFRNHSRIRESHAEVGFLARRVGLFRVFCSIFPCL